MKRIAALLRAVNVGGAGKLPMADLKRVLGDLGHEDPKTLLASGNAVFGAKLSGAELEAALEREIAARLGVGTDVLVREHAELVAVMKANPFTEMAAERPSALLVLFLKDEPTAAGVAAAKAAIRGPEMLEAGPRCLYIAYVEGMGTSKLTGRVLERALKLRGTGRNWNTVRKLTELTA